MHQTSDSDVRAVAGQFAIPGELLSIDPFERGHIHDTFVSSWRHGGRSSRFLHQRMNGTVFRDLPALMNNIERVTTHLRSHSGDLRTLELVPTRGGTNYLIRPSGAWRTYVFIENTASYDQCTGSELAYQAAHSFGNFQARLVDLDVGTLRETIPGFFDSPLRLRQLEAAVARDVAGRVAGARDAIEFALERRALTEVIDLELRRGRMPLRTVHGDTKLNNVLFDVDDGHAVCVVDLDTCMPAWSLYDFGDLVRFTAARSREDETDLDAVGMDIHFYDALVDGYLDTASSFLTADEVALMPVAARLVTLTIGLRFLADHLAGDVYFKVARPGHNLDRARVQFGMVASMEAQDAAMRRRLPPSARRRAQA